jgi:hypothetical protein
MCRPLTPNSCPAGRYLLSANLSTCGLCPEGTYSLEGSDCHHVYLVHLDHNCSSLKSFFMVGSSQQYFEFSSKSASTFFKANYLCSQLFHGAHLFQPQTWSTITSSWVSVLGSVPITQIHVGVYNLGQRNFNWIYQSVSVNYSDLIADSEFLVWVGEATVCTSTYLHYS